MRGKGSIVKRIGWILVGGLIVGAVILPSGCSTRTSDPTLAPDSTWVYAGKKPGDLDARITFADKSKTSKKTGKRLGVTNTFEVGKDEKVYAFADLQNQYARGNRTLHFHMVWLDPEDETIYKKQVAYQPSDSLTTLSSTLSLPVGKRAPGAYMFRLYLFRELIAEKGFILLGEAIEEEKGAGSGDF